MAYGVGFVLDNGRRVTFPARHYETLRSAAIVAEANVGKPWIQGGTVVAAWVENRNTGRIVSEHPDPDFSERS